MKTPQYRCSGLMKGCVESECNHYGPHVKCAASDHISHCEAVAALTLCQPINKEKPKPRQKFCTCEEYQKGINAINGSIQMAWIHGVTPTQLTPFTYCPWCGNKIKKG